MISIKQHLTPALRLMRADKPIGTLLLVWPTLWALWLASNGLPPWYLIAIFIVGAFITRSAGCIINDLWDKDIDGHVKRTATRPLTSNAITTKYALGLLVILAFAALVLVSLLNTYSIILACIAAALTVLYPCCKRFFALPQLVLGITFNFGVLIAFAAIQNQLPPSAWLLYSATVFWTFAYDTAYAMVDRDDDLTLQLKSSAITLAQHDRLGIGLCQLATLICLIALALTRPLGAAYFIGLGAAALLFLYQHQLIKDRQRDRCFNAFLNNQWAGLAIWLGIAINSWLH